LLFGLSTEEYNPESGLVQDVNKNEFEDVHDDYLEIVLQIALNFTFGAACFEV